MPNPSANKAATALAMGTLGLLVMSADGGVAAQIGHPDHARAGPESPMKQRHLLLVGAPMELYRAFVASLGPWNIRITTRDARASMPLSTEAELATLAATERADAVAWIDLGRPGGASLWLFVGGKMVAGPRPLARPPYSDVQAAAIALSVKTLLRNSGLAPPPPPPLPHASAPVASAAPSVRATGPVPSSSSLPHPRPTGSLASVDPTPRSTPARPGLDLSATASLGARHSDVGWEPRARLGVDHGLSHLEGLLGGLGWNLTAEFGLPQRLSMGALDATMTSATVTAAVRYRLRLRSFGLEPFVGLGVEWQRVSAEPKEAGDISHARWIPVAAWGLSSEYAPTDWFSVGLELAIACRLHEVDYWVDGSLSHGLQLLTPTTSIRLRLSPF